MTDIIKALIRNVLETKYTDLTPEAIDYAKKSTLDTIAVAIAGSTMPGCKAVVDMVKEWGGKEESTIWIYGGKVPTTLAALAIGPMARVTDFGDVHERGGGHLSEYIIPAVVPIVEYLGKVKGRDFIVGVALGQDLMARLGMSFKMTRRWRLCRIFGPTAALARLLELDEDTTLNAMGIAYAQAAGDRQAYLDGAQTIYVEHGFVAEAAIKSVLLAQRGVTGAKNFLQGEYGFYQAFEPEHDLEVLTSELGNRYEGAYTSIKPYPSCKLTHAAISATIDLIKEHDLKPQNIAEIDIGVGENAYYGVCYPEEVKNNPQNAVECRFSLPYVIATAAVNGSVFIDDFLTDAINRSDIRKVMKKVKARIAPEVVVPDNKLVGGAIVSLKTKDGKEFCKTVNYAKGHPRNPMSIGDVIEKLRRCLPFSAVPIPRGNVDKIIEIVSNLEQVDDITKIAILLAP